MRSVHPIRAILCLAAMVLSPSQATAEDTPPGIGGFARPSAEKLAIPLRRPTEELRESDAREAMCLMIESAARAANLPLEFFARVIWQESRFQPDAVGPVTR